MPRSTAFAAPSSPPVSNAPYTVLGFVNAFKPAGPSSTQFAAGLRRIYGQRGEPRLPVGHLGTLDPQAAGVLPIALGKATRLIPLVEDTRKAYACTLVLGSATDTGDAAGTVIAREPVAEDIDARLARAIPTLLGAILQIPPMYSAVHVGGKRLYELARAGITVERKARPVTIYGITILGREEQTIRLRIACSGGTYIRTLCEDLARACDTLGHVGALLREASGPFVLSESLTYEDIAADPEAALVAPEYVIPLPTIVLDPHRATDFRAGRVVPCVDAPAQGHVFVRDVGRTLVGVGETLGTLLAPRKVFA